ncbi:MAG: hypothetical protein WC848_02600 [Parcubacteria group bacterium]
MKYQFAILDPRPIEAAQMANNAVFSSGRGALGVEVTVPALAARCKLGNIDPQHTGQDDSLAAIEVALQHVVDVRGECCGHEQEVFSDCVECSQPVYEPVVTLATIRADLDSVGAMAVLLIRAECEQNDWDTCNSVPGYGEIIQEAKDRIRLVAESDKFARGGWPGPRPLPTEESLFDDSSASTESDSRLAPMAAAVSDFKIPLAQRVEWMKRWLLWGEEPAGYREKWLVERKAIAQAVASGFIKASVAKLCGYCGYYAGVSHVGELCSHCYCDGGLEVQSIAAVVSTHRAATSIGYSLAPIVVALNPEFRFGGGEPCRKFTVCQFTAEYMDLRAVLAELAGLESGWGGSPTIGGSPQGVSSILTIDQVVEVVAKHLIKKCFFCGSFLEKPYKVCFSCGGAQPE